MKFKAIIGGGYRPTVINARFREMAEAITELQNAAGISTETETTQAVIPVATVETETVTAEAQDAPEDFDWRTTTDAEALKAYALVKYDLKIRKFKLESIRAEIESYISILAGE